jgi:formate hydrogenlyase subunit 3/multisubunit Na+/H+ antiporter MnhD subunit
MLSVFHDAIVDGLKPFTDWMQAHNFAGAMIIIGAMIIVSFPPVSVFISCSYHQRHLLQLLGHEILVVLCGVTFSFGEACIVDARVSSTV